MKIREFIIASLLLSAVTFLFFHKVFLKGYVPFPGDVLLSEFQPWRSASYDGYAPGGVPNKAQYPDTIRQIYPWKTITVSALKEGKLPLWNPYNFSGMPHLANFQSQALYPLNFFYLLFSQVNGWTVLVILQPLLASIFCYLYVRKIRVGPLGAFLAAVSYGYSGFNSVWLEYNTIGHVVLWLPLILLSVESLGEKVRVRWLVVLMASHAAAIFAGHPQVYAYMAAFSLVYAFCRLPRKLWAYISGFTLLGIGVASIQLVPGFELIVNAARSPHDPRVLFEKILIQPWQLASMVFPNIFGSPATRTYWPTDTFVGKVTTIGLVPLFFFLSATRTKAYIMRWFLVASAVTLTLITANPLTYILYRLPLPLVSASSPTLMSFLLAFSLSVVCGFGLDYWITEKHSIKKLIKRSVQVTAILLVLFVATKIPFSGEIYTHGAVVTRAIVYAALFASATLVLFWIAIRFPKIRIPALCVLLVIHVADLFLFFNRFNPFVPKTFVFPNHPVITYLKNISPERYWGYGTANINANFASQYQFFSPEGYDPLYPAWYGELLYGYKNNHLFTTFDNTTRSDAAISSVFGDGGLTNPAKQKILATLSVSYILDRVENGTTTETFPAQYLHPTSEQSDWRIYKNTYHAKRAFIASHVLLAGSQDEFNEIFFADSFDPTTSVILPRHSTTQHLTSASGSATIHSYEPEAIVIETQSTASGVLVVTDTYYPGWEATVNGGEAEIIPANWALRAVRIPSGKHIVTMTYKPASVMIGIYLSLISIGTAICLFLIIKRKQK